MTPRLTRLLEEHRAAVREYMDRAGAIDDVRWFTPRAEGKWTPAQETRHVILVYEALHRELSGGVALRLLGSPWRRRIWRVLALPSILWRRRIPRAARAPRELRPPEEAARAGELLPVLQERSESFDRTFVQAWTSTPGKRLTHPYFGTLSLEQSIRLLTVHTRHHAAFLPKSQREMETT
jgi:hypothetical protein